MALVKAVLGPTNTGKTHLAIERLLSHRSGMIGFPLRLLARENYDRMLAQKGAANVALITGEEKIVPPGARWFSCTVEAMPLERKVEFLAVDEIQLSADPDRGHIFTDRLLRVRGTGETLFLGAETIRPLLTCLIEAKVETRPRLSALSYSGHTPLNRLPPRSAVVAFSAEEVYAIAEAIRRRRGGSAVVMGRLSPRTRNAQVALYQGREVDFLVATDAIGMGLNMDVEHVAFAGLAKFDGRRPRPLEWAEIAQIAGRAGRGMRAGTFGTTGLCPPLGPDAVAAIESHDFPPLKTLVWRNVELDFASVDSLLDSLALPPPKRGLGRGHEACDALTLAALAREAEIRRLAQGRKAVALLWQACQIPDYRKLGDDSHIRLCGEVFRTLCQHGLLPAEGIARAIAALDLQSGDLDTLMQRLANIRVWSYITARTEWVRDAETFQAAARAVEDRLSEALHERLVSRFVDRRSTDLIRRLEAPGGAKLLSAVTSGGEVVVEGHHVGRIEGFSFVPDACTEEAERQIVLRAARRAMAAEIPWRIARLVAAPDSEFELTPKLAIAWQGGPLARLRRGPSPAQPLVEVAVAESLDGPGRERVRQRLQQFVDRLIRREFSPLFAAEARAAGDPALRGLAHHLVETLGVIPDPLPGREGAARLGARAGRFAVWLPAALKPRLAVLRAALWALWQGLAPQSLPPPAAQAARAPKWPGELALTLGWLPAGPVILRLDIAERIAAELSTLTRPGPCPLPANLAQRLGVKRKHLPAVLHALGFRLVPAAGLGAGETSIPLLLCPHRPRRGGAEAKGLPGDSAFAALSVLRGRAG